MEDVEENTETFVLIPIRKILSFESIYEGKDASRFGGSAASLFRVKCVESVR